MNIPPLDLVRQYETYKEEALEKIKQLCEEQAFILGEGVSSFEAKLVRYTGAKHAIGVSSGTDAIQLALMAIGLEAGDEIITTPFTFIATAEPVAMLGATPVFVDINPDTFNIDPTLIEAKITSKTKAIIVVHLYGQTADMDPIMEIANKHGLSVIEDTAQAMGSVYGPTGKQAGTIGDFGTISFFPSKNLGGFGDGGAVLTNDQTKAKSIENLRVHGSDRRYFHDVIGINGRLDAIQAVVLEVKLKYLDGWLKRRNEIADTLSDAINALGLKDLIQTPVVEKDNFHTYHQYILRVKKDRDVLLKHLNDEGIGARIYYPLPLHEQKCFSYLGYQKGSLPMAESVSAEILSLPIFPELTDKEVQYMVDMIKAGHI